MPAVHEPSLPVAAIERLRTATVVAQTAPPVFRIEGPGAVACLQGLLTNDVEKPGPGSLVYGALLTPKGMIVVDFWVLRDAEGFTLIGPEGGREAALDLFRRQLPPRLAKVRDLTDEWTAAWWMGPTTWEGLSSVHGLTALPGPESSRTAEVPSGAALGGSGRLTVAATWPQAPWRAIAVGDQHRVAALVAATVDAGAHAGDESDREAARILGGWPALGAEIEEKTLPQEVRYDEIGGVSYTKGCYVGQETVARVHFRGHPNRELRGVIWTAEAPPSARSIEREGKEVGQLRSLLRLGERHLGLARIRREVAPGDVVRIGPIPARVVGLPFAPEDVSP